MALRQQGELEDESFIFKKITWKIPNVLSLQGSVVDYEIRSSEFSFANGTWILCMYPNGQTQYGSKSFIDFTAYRLPSLEAEQCVYFKIFIQTCRGREFDAFSYSHEFTSGGVLDGGAGVHNFIKFSKLVGMQKTLAPGGTLTVVLQMRVKSTTGVEKVARPIGSGMEDLLAFVSLLKAFKDLFPRRQIEKSSIEVCTQTEGDFGIGSEQCTPDKKLVQDFQQLLLSEDDCDVTLLVKGQKFEAHRAILRARSPVFSSMLKHDMKERNTGLIDIADCDPEHFFDFLCFLYCGNIDGITSQNACSLYRAADKYNVQDLKSECLTFMKSHLDVENFCDVITLALQHGVVELVKQATDFFAQNMLKIIVTVKWQVFLHENTTEGNELIIKAANKISSP